VFINHAFGDDATAPDGLLCAVLMSNTNWLSSIHSITNMFTT